MNATKRRAIYETLQSLNPHPTTELEYTTPFELLIAVMLSAQATDVSVNKATRKMFPVANTPRQIVALGEEGVADYIKTIGLYRTKAKNVIATCHICSSATAAKCRPIARRSRPAGRRPQDRQRRAEHRVRRADDRGRHAHLPRREPHGPGARQGRAGRRAALEIHAEEFLHDAHHWLILHGRYVCKARKPNAGTARSSRCAFGRRRHRLASERRRPADRPAGCASRH
jgi:endonuclease-3